MAYPACDFLALTLAPASLVFAVDGMIVVWNVLFAPYTLGEPVTVSRLTGAAMITLGTFGVGGFGAHSEVYPSLAAYNDAFATPGGIVYFSLLPTVALLLAAMVLRQQPASRARGFWMALLAGWFGGCGICQKAGTIVFTNDPEHAWPWAFIYLGVAFACMLVAVVLLALTLRRHAALEIIPLYECGIIVQSALAGNLITRDFAYLPPWRVALYWTCLLLILCGLTLIVAWPSALPYDGDAPVPLFNRWLRPSASLNESSRLTLKQDLMGARRADAKGAVETATHAGADAPAELPRRGACGGCLERYCGGLV